MKTALVLACDDNFIPYTAVVARRVAGYASEKFPVFVLSDGVTDENKALARKFCPQIDFIEASAFFVDKTLPAGHGFSRATYMRLFLDDFLSGFDRAVYLDSDISPLTDVSPLLTMEPKAGPVIAAHDLSAAVGGEYRDRLKMTGPYFNGGVAVYDLKAIRAESIFRDALRYALDHPERCLFADQDALNAVLDGRWQTLDWRWNAMNYMGGRWPKQPFIRHFAGNKPWASKKIGVERRFVNEWQADLAESPWPKRFHEQSAKHALRAIFEPASLALSHLGRTLAHSTRNDRRGNKVRMRRQLPDILSNIERWAADSSMARPLSLTP
jgi:lipopolysaccharide biosynthesis glycosyltransferase